MAETLVKGIRTKNHGDCKIDYNSLANRPSSLKNPYAITFTGAASSKYDGSNSVTVNIPVVPEWANQDSNPSYTKSESDEKYATKQESDENYAPISAAIRPTVTGNPAVCEDSAAWRLQGLKIYGKSIQDGEPSPENPVPIVSAGDGGSVFVYFTGKNIDKKQIVGAIYSVFSSVTAEVKTDGIHINGTSTGSYGILYRYDLDPHLIIKGSTLFVSSNIDDGIYLQVAVKNNDGSDRHIYGNKSYTITGEEENLSIILQTSNVVKTFSDLVIYDYVSLTGKLDSWAPYCGTKYITLSTPTGLPGIPVESGGNFTDADGQQWICNYVNFNDRNIYCPVKKYLASNLKITLNGTWTSTNPNYAFAYAVLSGSKPIKSAICNTFKQIPYTTNTSPINEQGIMVETSKGHSTIYFIILKSNLTEISDSAVKTFLTSISTEFIAANLNPDEAVNLSPEELSAYRALTTYDGTTVVSTAEPVAGIEARYVADGTKYLQSVTDRIAALEAAQTSV